MKQMKNEIIPWWVPFNGDREKELVLEVLASQYLNEGEYVEKFENSIKTLLGAKYAVATTSGTAAIFLALKAVGVGQGDEVIVPDITFIATANAVRLAGATPILVDVEAATLNIDPKSIRKAITQKTKCIIPVHVSGRGASMKEVQKIADEFRLAVVEDAAEALTSKVDGKCLGTFAKAGCFSFSANKTVSTGQGGMVVTNDENIFLQLKELKDHGRPVRGTGGDDLHHSVGFNFKMTNLQAAIGLGQLERLDERKRKMRSILEMYRESLHTSEDLGLFPFSREEVPQWTDAIYSKRDVLVSYLKERGVQCRNLWHPLHTQKPYRQDDSKFPTAMRVGYKSFWLPSSFQMSEAQQARVCALINDFISYEMKKAA